MAVNELQNVLHFSLMPGDCVESHHYLEDLLCRSLDEYVGEDSFAALKGYREGVVG